MEEEKKKMSKETKKLLIIISSFIAVVIIVGVVFGVVFPQLNKKEVQTSSQLENENIQEEKKEENTIPDYIELSDTSFTGATFKKKWSELKKETDDYFEEKFNDNLNDGFYRLLVNKGKAVEKKRQGQEYTEYDIFIFNKYINNKFTPSIYISATVDDTTDNVIGITYGYLGSTLDETSLDAFKYIQNLVSTKVKQNTDNLIQQMSTAKSNGKDLTSKDVCSYYHDNMCSWLSQNATQTNIMVFAASDAEIQYHKENGTWREKTQTNTSSNTNSTVVADIQDRIDFFNSYYAWNFHPTNEQMQQMVEFANSTSNFTNDTLADFIIDKGWLPDSGTGTVSSNNSSSTTNNGNSSSSNKNTSSSNNDDDDNTSKEVTATVNINLKELIAKNTVATEIKNESERIDIRVYVEDAFVKDDYFEYFSGGASVPNIITTTVKVYENEKKLNDKRKVIITMDNTRTLIKETTLYDGEMIFNKTGTYEIK